MSRTPSAPRRRSREAALQVLYALDLGDRPSPRAASGAGDAPPPRDPRDPAAVLADVAAHFELPPAARDFTEALVRGVAERREALDEAVQKHAEHWRLSRMAAVDRNILRLAAFELLHTDTPVEIVIDQAVELATRYSGERSPAFVNGVLDALARSARP